MKINFKVPLINFDNELILDSLAQEVLMHKTLANALGQSSNSHSGFSSPPKCQGKWICYFTNTGTGLFT